jgi:hypothetical protein
MKKNVAEWYAQPEWYNVLSQLVQLDIFPRVAHRVLLWGPKGTGKSSWPEHTFGANRVERIPLHRQMFVEDLIGGVQLKDGSTVWADGPATRCLREGKVLVLDEVDQYSPEIRSALHSILDDRAIAGVTLPTGERVRPAEGFAVVGTTNVEPSEIHEVLLDRFDLVLHADRPADGILSQLSDGARSVLTAQYGRMASSDWRMPFSARSALAMQRIISAGHEPAAAARLVFGAGADAVLTAIATATK